MLFQHLYNQLNIGCLASSTVLSNFDRSWSCTTSPAAIFGWQHDQEAGQNNSKMIYLNFTYFKVKYKFN
jgi:hypothetical protein